MRIISGKNRGVPLNTPEDGTIRPTSDRMREGLFSVLTSGQYQLDLTTLTVLDVFAGTGAMGLEALSRGARKAIFIENNPKAVAVLNSNILRLKAQENTTIISRDATRSFAWKNAIANKEPAQLVILDPPWMKTDDSPNLTQLALDNLITIGAIAPHAIINIEHDYRRNPVLSSLEKNASLEIIETRKWGKSACTIARLTNARLGSARPTKVIGD